MYSLADSTSLCKSAALLNVALSDEILLIRFEILSDKTFNLCTGKYQPYKKPNDTHTYIIVNTNHPPNIIKALPDNISKRMSDISSDKATFNNAAPFHNDVRSASEYKENLTYQQDLPPCKESKTKKDNMV